MQNEANKGMATVTAKPKLEPKTMYPSLYHVILHNDEDHTYEYVIEMLMTIFKKSQEEAHRNAEEVHTKKLSIVDTTYLERAEMRSSQINTYGPDPRIPNCKGSMTSTIEKAE